MRNLALGVAIALVSLLAYGLGAQGERSSSIRTQWESAVGKEGYIHNDQLGRGIPIFQVTSAGHVLTDLRVKSVSGDHVVLERTKPLPRSAADGSEYTATPLLIVPFDLIALEYDMVAE